METLRNAVPRATPRSGRSPEGARPSLSRFTRLVSSWTAGRSSPPPPTSCWRKSGLRPLGPGAAPRGKDRTARRTSSAAASLAGGGGGRADAAWCGGRGGNLLRMAPTTAGVGSATFPPLSLCKALPGSPRRANCTAASTCCCSGSADEGPLCWRPRTASSHSSRHSPSPHRSRRLAAKLWFRRCLARPPGSTPRQVLGNMNSSVQARRQPRWASVSAMEPTWSQASGQLLCKTRATQRRNSFSAMGSKPALTKSRVATGAAMISSSEGRLASTCPTAEAG